MSNQESEMVKGLVPESIDPDRKLYKNELKDACKRIAHLRKPISEIARIVKPLGIPYYTVFNVFIGESNRQEVLDALTDLGIPHNRKPIRHTRKKKGADE